MNIKNLSGIPEWNDDKFTPDEGDEWKHTESRQLAKNCYNQWRSIAAMVLGVVEDMPMDDLREEAEMMKSVHRFIMEDTFIVCAKIRSAEVANMYILRMENASIIRSAAQRVASQLLTLIIVNAAEEEHVTIIRKEIDHFRSYFRQWVATFQKDEYDDEWGLFI